MINVWNLILNVSCTVTSNEALARLSDSLARLDQLTSFYLNLQE